MQGQEVVIIDRGKPVGKIVPVLQDHLSLAERIKKMEEQGLLDRCEKKDRYDYCRRCLRARVSLRNSSRRIATHEL
ncbi:MAG TPA: hypothetical protein VMV04_06980 [Thermodesulfobacteriota bacterium]|jgi:antitoxin (DNA-binding transcriptional repressor) of toxin-antitoxin stability system|nr:hypothetical protein [Thermodesulfobacteriota bacterium]